MKFLLRPMLIRKLFSNHSVKLISTSTNYFNQKPPKPPDISEIFEQLLGGVQDDARIKSDVTFQDVAGLHEAKQEVKEFLDYFKDNTKFVSIGAKLPKGALLLGPPGCGKTLLVKALANEADVPFFYKAGSEFVEIVGGRGAARVRQLFKTARSKAPAIIFIDEIDAIGSMRYRSSFNSGGGEKEQTLNQLLVEMDGMDTTEGVVVFAATNRQDVLDKALLRSGRFDRHILIDLPTISERREILELYLKKYKVAEDIETLRDRLATLTPGMSGADLSNLCNEAALYAAKVGDSFIRGIHFEVAVERIIAGAAKKSKILTESERRLVAFHEAGHALVGWMLKTTDKLLRISIVPRTSNALGFVQVTPKDRHFINTTEVLERMCVLLGGRVAESLVFNHITSGAQDDLRKVTDLAYNSIREWGMSNAVGHLSFQYDGQSQPLYGKKTQMMIDAEANIMVTKAYRATEELVKEHRDKLNTIAEALLKKEVLTYTDMCELIGPPPHQNTKNSSENK